METVITYSQFITLLNGSEKNDALIISQLKQYNGTDVRLLGAKAFIEANADVDALTQFLAYKPVAIKSSNKNSGVYKIAASVVLIIGLSIVGYNLFHKNETDTMLAYYTKDVGLSVMMGSEDHSRFDEAMTHYKQDDYLKTKQLLLVLNATTPNNDTIAFYLGEVAVLTKTYTDAKHYYQSVLPSSVFYTKAQFKFGLTLYISNDKEKAKDVFTSLLHCSDTEVESASAVILKECAF